MDIGPLPVFSQQQQQADEVQIVVNPMVDPEKLTFLYEAYVAVSVYHVKSNLPLYWEVMH